jgi:hypothetical protein
MSFQIVSDSSKNLGLNISLRGITTFFISNERDEYPFAEEKVIGKKIKNSYVTKLKCL